jgi:hypothetical protein
MCLCLLDLLVAVGLGRELGHLEEVLVVFVNRRCEEEGSCLQVLGDGHVVPQIPVAERRDLAPLAVVLRLPKIATKITPPVSN